MSVATIVVLVLLAVSLVAGSLTVRAKPFAVGRSAESLSSRLVQFLAGFFCWPIVLTFLLFLLIIFGDLLWNEDVYKELMKKEGEAGSK